MPRPREVLTGRSFGRWTVIADTVPDGRRPYDCLTRCACGKVAAVRRSALTRGATGGCQRCAADEPAHRERARALGLTRSGFRVPEPGYFGAHMRVKRMFGPASRYRCIDCGNQAREWSYDHTDPSELLSKTGLPYSVWPEFYAPRCSSCHVRADQRHARDKR